MNNNLNSISFDCTGCGLCKNICPSDAISIKLDNEGFLKYEIDESKCTNCGKCLIYCPRLKPLKIETKVEIVYSAYSKDDNILKKSSSGGMFSVIAEHVINLEGVVCGAAFNADGKVEHILVDNTEDLEKLRGSKYIQSDISNIYLKIEEVLNKNIKVLFSGVPCQVVAIKRYFEKHINFKNLILIDIVCHGVPSYNVYLDNLKKHRAFKINFRDKKIGWNRYYLTYLNESGKKVRQKRAHKDKFFVNYIKNIYLAKACYICTANVEKRPGDISLGDFWNIAHVDSGFFDRNQDKGVSFVLINTKAGEEIFKAISEKLIYKIQKREEAVKYNPRISSGVYREEFILKRQKFFKKFNKKTKKIGDE